MYMLEGGESMFFCSVHCALYFFAVDLMENEWCDWCGVTDWIFVNLCELICALFTLLFASLV